MKNKKMMRKIAAAAMAGALVLPATVSSSKAQTLDGWVDDSQLNNSEVAAPKAYGPTPDALQYEYQKQEEDKMAALHAKIVVSDARRSLVSSANLSYHGMQGNIEMGFLIESSEKAKQIEQVMKEMVRMKVFCKYRSG